MTQNSTKPSTVEPPIEALAIVPPPEALTVSRPPDVVLEEARKAAAALADVLSKKRKPVLFNGEQYLEFEDWQTLGRFYGVTAKVRATKHVAFGEEEWAVRGFEATADAVLVSTGQVISSAEAMCLSDEPNWFRKPMFQLRSMAQTRACAKALRNVLAWVVVLAGYKPTPAEEMPPQNAPIENHGIKKAQRVAPQGQQKPPQKRTCPTLDNGEPDPFYQSYGAAQAGD